MHGYGAALHATPGAWLADADVVVSAVYGHAALAVAAQALPHLRGDALYADYTTASAADMRTAAERAAGRGVAFADVAIMGAIALLGDRTPLLCAGTGAEAAAAFARTSGAPAQAIAGQAGDAVRLKLLRSIMTKGMESLAVECLVAAERMGLRDALYDVLADIDRTPRRPSWIPSFARSRAARSAGWPRYGNRASNSSRPDWSRWCWMAWSACSRARPAVSTRPVPPRTARPRTCPTPWRRGWRG